MTTMHYLRQRTAHIDRRESVARHECAHAIVGLALGASVEAVRLEFGSHDTNGCCVFRNDLGRMLPSTAITILLVGEAMNRARGDIPGDTRGPQSDRQRAFDIADQACRGDRGKAFAMAMDCLDRAVELIGKHRMAIERAGEALCGEGELNESQLRAILLAAGDVLGRSN
jgi:hypothetical protein